MENGKRREKFGIIISLDILFRNVLFIFVEILKCKIANGKEKDKKKWIEL